MSENHENRIELLENGPVYFKGDIKVQNSAGETVLEKEKVALCRCGQSTRKPACDGTHRKAGFEADCNADLSDIPPNESDSDGKLVVKALDNGPLLVEGTYTLVTENNGEYTSDKTIALCRCGGSSNKPFCDGTHKQIEFKAE